MKNFCLTGLLLLSLSVAGCQSSASEAENAAKNAANTNAENVAPKTQQTGEIKFPDADYPATATTAKEGEYVLVPLQKSMLETYEKGLDQAAMVWYSQKMVKPGAEKSEIEFSNKEKHEVPNAYIIAIPAGGKAKKGDIVLTWWQSGSGMQRAIVVDDSNPAEPVVRYLDMDYVETSSNGKTPTSQTDEKLKPNSFKVLTNELQAGSMIKVNVNNRPRPGQVLNVSGDKVFVRLFAGKIAVYPKSEVKPVPLKSKFKVGDKVSAVYIAEYKDAVVKKVDEKIGRVWVNFPDIPNSDRVVSFGNITPVE
jgi:hypothetical protein